MYDAKIRPLLYISPLIHFTEYLYCWHFGIAEPWAWTLDLEMLDSGPRFGPKNTQNLLLFFSIWTRVY